jgi:glucan phosphoethanolaminetransferase (alkaline phosphatase superfamily)
MSIKLIIIISNFKINLILMRVIIFIKTRKRNLIISLIIIKNTIRYKNYQYHIMNILMINIRHSMINYFIKTKKMESKRILKVQLMGFKNVFSKQS